MRTPIRFKAETKYTESAEKKANTNLPIMARVGDGGTVNDAVTGRPGWYHIRLVNDGNRLTQCKAAGVGLVYDDWIYVVKARDRNLTYYAFHSFVQSTGGLLHPILHARGIIIPDNTAQAFYIVDDDSVGLGSPEYVRFVTTDGAQAVEWNFGDADVNFIINANAVPDAFLLDGATGAITLAALLTVNAGITMGGASGANEITIPGNAAIAMEILDTNAIEYLRIDTAPQLVIDFNQGQVDIDFVVRWDGGRAFDMRGDLGHIAMGTLAQTGIHCYIWDSTVSTTTSYTGLSVFHGKTAGVTDQNDAMYGIRNYFAFNQAGGEIGHWFGFENQTVLTTGNIGDAVNSRNAYAIYDVLALTAGRIYGDAYGANIRIDQEAGNTIDDDAFVGYFWGDFDGTVTGDTYMCYLDEQNGVDYGIYQSGTARHYLQGTTAIGGTDSVAAQLYVDQSAAGGAIPVLLLDQGDESEEFIRFIGETADGVLTNCLVKENDVFAATRQGFFEIYVRDDDLVDPIADDAYYVAFYTLA